MIGLLILAIAIPLLVGYVWLLKAIVRYVKRKTGSSFVASIAFACMLFFAFGDVAINRWYHKEILCQHEAVGFQLLERVNLPPQYLDSVSHAPKLPFPLDTDPFFSRFSLEESRSTAGIFPFTANGRIERRVIDRNTGHVLARFVDYWPSGGPWWLAPLKWLGEDTLIGWLRSRQSAPSCLDRASQNSLLSVSQYFYAIYSAQK